MIHFRGEGELCRYGLNVYPWRERRTSIGFILRARRWWWRVRYAPKTGIFNNKFERCLTIAEQEQQWREWQAGVSQ